VINLNRSSSIPLYFQLKQLLLDRIESGGLKPGDLIPGDIEMQSLYGVSRTTVRQALNELALEGLVTRSRGRGTFVTQPKLSHRPHAGQTLSDSLRVRGLRPGWQVRGFGMVPAPRLVALNLQVEPGTPVFWSSRLRLADGEPIGHLVAHAAVRDEEIEPTSLGDGRSLSYLAVDDRLEGARADRIIEAVAAEEDEAALLGVEGDAPMLLIQRILVTAGGRPLEDFRGIYRGDQFQYLTSGALDLAAHR
jgi:GntR family transcriptional regulator